MDWTDKSSWYPAPGEYLAIVRKADAITAAGGKVRTFWGNPELDAVRWHREKMKALNGRINLKGGLDPHGRKTEYNYQNALRRDRDAGQDYRLHRILRRGSGLETEYGRRAYPDAHAAFREPLDS